MLFFEKECKEYESETITFLDIQENHITKDGGHINNKAFSKNASKIGNFSVL